MTQQMPSQSEQQVAANYRNVEDVVRDLTKQVDTQSVGALLRRAVEAGKQLGGRDAIKQLAARIEKEASQYSPQNDEPSREKRAKIMVQCPYPGCTKPGIRPLHCFCQHHYDTVPEEKRNELRQKQIAARKKAREQQAEAERQALLAQVTSGEAPSAEKTKKTRRVA